jgi:hypothetical protein
MMPPDTQPVHVALSSFKQQQSSNKWQVVTSGQVSGQLSHQEKQGCNLQQQCSQCGSFSWQQPLQSQQVSQPQELQLDELLQDGAALQLVSHDGAALQLASHDGAALQLLLVMSDETA